MAGLAGSEPTSTGIGFVVMGALLTVTALGLRTRAPAFLVALLLAAAGAEIGWGGIILQPDPSDFETVFTVLALALLVPFHFRVVAGHFGPRRNGDEGQGGR